MTPDYKNATVDMKIEMEKVMDAIDRAPDSLEAVFSFGAQHADELGKVATSMLRVQGETGRQMTALTAALRNTEHGLDAANDALHEDVMTLIEHLYDGAISAKDKNTVARISADLPTMMANLAQIVTDVGKTDTDLLDLFKDAGAVAEQHEAAVSKLNVCLGAAEEVLRRYNDEYIPEARKALKESLDPEDGRYLKNVLTRKEDFINRVATLHGIRANNTIARQLLTRLTDALEDQHTVAQNILQNTLPEWQTLLMSAQNTVTAVSADCALQINGSGKPATSDAFPSAVKKEKQSHPQKKPHDGKKQHGAPKAPG